MLWALVPLKQLSRSKRRLGSVLESEERKGLALAMARDVLLVIRQHAAVDGALLVSRAPEATKLAQECDVGLFAESPGSGLSQALTEASRHVARNHAATTVLIVPSDVPLIRDDDISAVLKHHDRITLVPDIHGEGTNALLMSPPNLIAYAFGKRSLQDHLESSAAAGANPLIVRNSRISHDIDNPEDLAQLLDDLPHSATGEYLRTSGIAGRLRNSSLCVGTVQTQSQTGTDPWT